MRKAVLAFACVVLALITQQAVYPARQEQKEPERRAASKNTEWVAKSLKEMQTVKAGMTRADLLKVFEEEGGLFTRRQRTFVFHGCRYFKVDVKFEPVGSESDELTEYGEDKIVSISKPYIDWSVVD